MQCFNCSDSIKNYSCVFCIFFSSFFLFFFFFLCYRLPLVYGESCCAFLNARKTLEKRAGICRLTSATHHALYSPLSLSLLVWHCGDWSHLSIAESTFHILIELRLKLLLGMGRYDTFASTSFYASCWLPFCHSSSLAFEEGREREGEGEEKGRKAEGVSCLSTYHTVHSFTMSANLASVECLPLPSLSLSISWFSEKSLTSREKKENI